MKKLILAAVTMAAVAGTAAESRTRCFDKPWMGVAEGLGEFFRNPANEMTKEGLEKYADSILAGGKVTHVFWCAVSGRANFDSKATEPVWAGLADPATEYGIVKTEGGLLPIEKPDEIAANKRWAENAKKLHDAGIDPYRVLIDRTHAKGAQAWLTLRMTDMHYSHWPHHFRTPSYFVQHPDLLIPPGHGGGSPDYGFPQSREWFAGVVAETAARYKDVDGIEIDMASGDAWLFGKNSPGTGNLTQQEQFAKYFADIKKTMVRETGNPKVKLAVRIAYDANFFDMHFGMRFATFPVDVTILSTPRTRRPPLSHRAEVDRYAEGRIVPSVRVAELSMPRISGLLSWIRGCEFPGVILRDLGNSREQVRKAVLEEGLADFDKGVKGPREIVLVSDEYLMEWKRAAWGYVDVRSVYYWKLDKPWKYEFSLQEGSVAERSVVAEVSFSGVTVPPVIYLNGRKSTSFRKDGMTVTYVFPKTAVFGGVNQLYIPEQAQEDELELDDVKSVTTSVGSATVRIDM